MPMERPTSGTRLWWQTDQIRPWNPSTSGSPSSMVQSGAWQRLAIHTASHHGSNLYLLGKGSSLFTSMLHLRQKSQFQATHLPRKFHRKPENKRTGYLDNLRMYKVVQVSALGGLPFFEKYSSLLFYFDVGTTVMLGDLWDQAWLVIA